MKIESHVNTFYSSISYYFNDIAIDPGDYLICFSKIKFVLLTHVHYDHIYGLNNILMENPNVIVYTNSIGKSMLFDARKNLSLYNEIPYVFDGHKNVIEVKNNEILNFGDLSIKAVFTPGHNPSCISWIVGNNIFTGDSYIPGIKTVTNLPGGNKKQAEESIKLIKTNAKDYVIYPGHKIN